MANMARLYQVSRAIRRFPENSEQAAWHDVEGDEDRDEPTATVVKADDGQHPGCGTTLCAAGWAGFLFAPEGARLVGENVVFADGTEQHIEVFANEALELTRDQSSALFHTSKDADDIDVAIDALEDNPDIDGFDLRAVVRQYRAEMGKSSAFDY